MKLMNRTSDSKPESHIQQYSQNIVSIFHYVIWYLYFYLYFYLYLYLIYIFIFILIYIFINYILLRFRTHQTKEN